MYELTLAEIHEGDTVRAFHPRTMGVIYTGTVRMVGRTLVHVHFPISDTVHKLAPRDVVEVIGR